MIALGAGLANGVVLTSVADPPLRWCQRRALGATAVALSTPAAKVAQRVYNVLCSIIRRRGLLTDPDSMGCLAVRNGEPWSVPHDSELGNLDHAIFFERDNHFGWVADRELVSHPM